MENVTNSTEYDSYLVSHVKSYMVTEFLGRGQYERTPFNTLEDARAYEYNVQAHKPNARIIVYGLSKPPHAIKTVSIAIS
tara:strand:- start:376 stop:615 length:240 start_codon:yes stop_codon:yes gene_type:complete